MKTYLVYIILCSDKSYYTGITSNLDARMIQHSNGEYSGYTKSRRPVILVFTSDFDDVNDAIAAEKQIKGWSRAKKKALIRSDFEALRELSKSRPSLRLRSG